MMIHRIYAIALNTFRETVRSKILYTVLFFAVAVCAAASAFGRVTIGDQSVVVITFGLFCTSLFSVLFVMITGSALFAKEISRRTIFTLLARPIMRPEFIIGKWLGLWSVATLLIVLMALSLAVYGELFFSFPAKIVCSAAIFMIMESAVISALVMLFSALVVTPLFIGVFSLSVFLAGRSASSILSYLSDPALSDFGRKILEWCYIVLPKLELLSMSDRLVAGQELEISYYIYSLAYSIGDSALILLCAMIIFNRREFN